MCLTVQCFAKEWLHFHTSCTSPRYYLNVGQPIHALSYLWHQAQNVFLFISIHRSSYIRKTVVSWWCRKRGELKYRLEVTWNTEWKGEHNHAQMQLHKMRWRQLTRVSRRRDPTHVELGPVKTREGTVLLTQLFPTDWITSSISVLTRI